MPAAAAGWLASALLLLLGSVSSAPSRQASSSSSRPCPAACDPRKAPSCDGEKGCYGGGGSPPPRAPGEPCGVYTAGCAPGLRCVPRPGERAPLHALLRGQGICAPPGGGGDARKSPTEAAPAAGEKGRTDHSSPEALPLQSQDPLQEVAVGKAQLEQFSLSSDTKQEFDTAPCRMHLATILQELKAPLYLNGEDIFIPNCDTKGFYRRKQCRASKGQKRGQCWCVDKRGRRMEGLEATPLCLVANSD